MSISKTGLDWAVLPNQLLSIAKSHLRVDGIYDDHTIGATLARSISWFERETHVSVNPVTYTWKPAYADFCDGVAAVPVSPVNPTWAATVDAVDVTASYEILTDSIHGIELERLYGVWVSGLTLTIPSGYASAAAIEPGIVDAILRYAAHLYEHREILVPGMETVTPGWMTDVVSTYWRPRV